MSVRAPLCALVALSLFVPGAARAQPQTGIVRPDREASLSKAQLGAQLFAGNCASCHGIDGRGVSPARPQRGVGDVTGAGPSLKGVGALAADFYLRTGYMPLGGIHEQPTRSRVLLSEREIRALVSFVASLGNGPPIPRPTPATRHLAKGLQLFTEHCAGCHQVVAQGGVVTGARVPPLEDASALQIAEAVRIGPYLMPRFSKRQISDRDLNALIAYIQYTKHPRDPGGWPIGNLGPVPEGMVTWLLAIVVLLATCVLIGKRLRA